MLVNLTAQKAYWNPGGVLVEPGDWRLETSEYGQSLIGGANQKVY